jgi:hypothetical protein
VVLSWLLKEVPLRNVSGQQARREAAEASRAAEVDLSINEARDAAGTAEPSQRGS